MKVTGTGPGSADKARDIGGAGAATPTTPGKGGRRTSVAPEVDSGISEKVAISGKARDSATAKALAKSAPDVSAETDAKIARLKAAIQGGTYSVDAEKVADKLVDDHLFNSI